MLGTDPEQFDVISDRPTLRDWSGRIRGWGWQSWVASNTTTRTIMKAGKLSCWTGPHSPIEWPKPECHAYVFCDIDNFHELKRIMQGAGWWVTRTPFICTKPNSGRVPHPEHGPRRQWEMILYAIRGKKKTLGIFPDVITTFADANMTHGAQKPVALYSNALKRSVRPGDRVLDSLQVPEQSSPPHTQLSVLLQESSKIAVLWNLPAATPRAGDS